MSIALIDPHYVFGASVARCKNAVEFVNNETVIYPAGANLVLFDMTQNSQSLIVGTNRLKPLTALAVSRNRRFVAVAEEAHDNQEEKQPLVSVYDTPTLKKRKVLNAPQVHSSQFISLAFSPGSGHLVALGGAPEWTLVLWSWETSKIMATVTCGNPLSRGCMAEVSFSPTDDQIVCVVGDGAFHLFRYYKQSLMHVGTQKSDYPHLTCHAWLNNERVLCGTDDSHLVLYVSGDSKKEFLIRNVATNKKTAAVVHHAEGDETDFVDDDATLNNLSDEAVSAIVSYAKGFACACGLGLVHLFEKTADDQYFQFLQVISIATSAYSYIVEESGLQFITTLSVNPSEEILACATKSNQLYALSLQRLEVASAKKVQFELLGVPFNSGKLTGFDICIRKQYFVTSSTDKSVRIWNYQTRNGGHLFAAVSGNLVRVYSSITFDNICTLRAHSGVIKCVTWSSADLTLVSCGLDGAVYEWDIGSYQRIGENVIKNCLYTNAVVSKDGRHIYAVGSDSTVKEIVDSQVVRCVPTPDTVLKSVSVSRSGRHLFVGTDSGSLRSMKFPLRVPGEWAEYTAHYALISRMRLTHNDEYLLTASDDSCVVMWKLRDADESSKYNDKFTFAQEILITKSELEEKNVIISDLRTRIEELKFESAYQLHVCVQTNADKIRDLNENFGAKINALHDQINNMNVEAELKAVEFQQMITDIQEQHEKASEDKELLFGQKIMLEYEKFEDLEMKSTRMQEDYELRLQETIKKSSAGADEMIAYFETKLRDANKQIAMRVSEFNEYSTNSEGMMRQIEEDSDREIVIMKQKYVKQLDKEKENIEKLKEENSLLKTKFNSMQRDLGEQKARANKLQSDLNVANNVINNLEKDVVALNGEVNERNGTIQNKEKRVYELKMKNQELEKYKFVLDSKIQELTATLEPKQKEIKHMNVQITEMEDELEGLHNRNKILDFSVSDERQKLKAMESQMISERNKARDLGSHLNRVQCDIYAGVNLVTDPDALKTQILAMFRTHVNDDFKSGESQSVDQNIQKEHSLQRSHLEMTVASLLNQLSSSDVRHRKDSVRIMQENVLLIRELCDLRLNLKEARTKMHDLQIVLGLHKTNHNMTPAEMINKIASSTKNAQMEFELSQHRNIEAIQTATMLKLRNELCVLEEECNSSSRRPDPSPHCHNQVENQTRSRTSSSQHLERQGSQLKLSSHQLHRTSSLTSSKTVIKTSSSHPGSPLKSAFHQSSKTSVSSLKTESKTSVKNLGKLMSSSKDAKTSSQRVGFDEPTSNAPDVKTSSHHLGVEEPISIAPDAKTSSHHLGVEEPISNAPDAETSSNHLGVEEPTPSTTDAKNSSHDLP